MAIEENFVTLLFETIRDRCISLQKKIESLSEKKYPTRGPYLLLKFIGEANLEIQDYLENIKRENLLQELREEDIEIYIYRYSKLIPYLHILLKFITGAETESSPSPLINSLQRLIKQYLPDAEIILASGPYLNYSYFKLSDNIKAVFNQYFEDLAKEFPENLIVITLPDVEIKNTLYHCIIAHEIGHGIYTKNTAFSEELQELIYNEIKEEEIEQLAEYYYHSHQSTQPTLFQSLLQVKLFLMRKIIEIINNWIEELVADGIGLCILGPAYYFSFIHFITSIRYINDSTESHPSSRIRISFMSKLIKNKTLNFLEIFDSKMKNLFFYWEKLSNKEITEDNRIQELVKDKLYLNFDKIIDKIINSMNNNLITSNELKDSDILKEMIVNIIPPNEIINPNTQEIKTSTIYSILNAGWKTYISYFDEFHKNIEESLKNNTKFNVKEKLNEILTKALELREIREISNE